MSEFYGNRRRLSPFAKVSLGIAAVGALFAYGKYEQSQEREAISSGFNNVFTAAEAVVSEPGDCEVSTSETSSTVTGANGERLIITLDDNGDKKVIISPYPDSASVRVSVGPEGALEDGYVRDGSNEGHTSNPDAIRDGQIVRALGSAIESLEDFPKYC